MFCPKEYSDPNVINALHLARQIGATTVGLLGAEGGKIKDIVDAYVLAPGQNIEQEEDAHMILAHVITRYMREAVRMYMQSGQDHRVDWAILAAT